MPLFLLLFVLFLAPTAYAQTGPCPGGAPLAFEGAEGYGRCAQGGRGGVVVDVTNLNNSGPGSLRECAEVMSGPRTCRVMVAGTINLSGDITIRNDYVTIDGSPQPVGSSSITPQRPTSPWAQPPPSSPSVSLAIAATTSAATSALEG